MKIQTNTISSRGVPNEWGVGAGVWEGGLITPPTTSGLSTPHIIPLVETNSYQNYENSVLLIPSILLQTFLFKQFTIELFYYCHKYT